MAYGVRPVPQNIMSVEFKLFDFMTLKQFIISFIIIIFCIILFIFLPVPWKILVPLFLIIVGGIVIFVPFNGEPFSEFLSAYLEAMILPQRRVWNKKGVVVKTAVKKAQFFQYGNDPKEDGNTFKFAEAQSIKVAKEQETTLDVVEQNFLQNKPNTSNLNTTVDQSAQNSSVPSTYNTNSNTSNQTSVSSKSVYANVNLNQYRPPTAQNNAATPQNQIQQSDSPAQKPPVVEPVQISIPAPQPAAPQSPAPSIPAESQSPNNTPASSAPVQEAIPQPNYLSSESQIQSTVTPQKAESPLPKPAENTVESPQDQIQPNAQDTQIQELAQLVAPKRPDPEEDEFAVKNYIFGSVEDEDAKPVIDAAIVIKKGEENLEVIYTNDNGDFQSHYEYKAGEYTIYVNYKSKEFNQITFEHDPIDSLPIVIRPKYTKSKEESLESEDDLIIQSSNSEIFDGTYDSNAFSLGANYSELENSNLHVANTAENPQAPALPKDKHAEFYQSIMQSRQSDDDNLATNTAASLDFKNLPDSNEHFEEAYISVPNTINGIVLDNSNNSIGGVLIGIKDQNNTVIRMVATGPDGKFYSFSPLQDGKYILELKKEGLEFEQYTVELLSTVIPPKDVYTLN